MKIAFRCPHCKVELSFEDLAQDQSPCPQCGTDIPLFVNAALRERNLVDHCVLCNCPGVYIQKDFNRTLGIAIIIAAAIACLILASKNLVLLGYSVLFVAAIADMLLYKLLPDVVICYRCHAQYRSFSPSPAAAAFELGLAEKYDPIQKTEQTETPAAEWKQR